MTTNSEVEPSGDALLYPGARILIIDDEPANVRLLHRVLSAGGYTSIMDTTDPEEGIEMYRQQPPDLLLLDLMMHRLDGFQVMEHLGLPVPESFDPVLVLTADATHSTRRRALARGATDFLTKPVDTEEVLLRVRNILRTRFQHLLLQYQNDVLEARVAQRTTALEAAYVETVERLAQAVEFRDDATGNHTRRVGANAALLALQIGLSEAEAETIRRAALLHDLGKIAIPDAVLFKAGRLGPDEFEIVKGHAVCGARLLSNGRSELLRIAEAIALSHHERWDGKGYPYGVAGHEIPLAARIVAIVDVFDALLQTRPYKASWPLDQAREELRRESGRQFDPVLVDAFLQIPENRLHV